jgi:uncharacterized membrane protein YhaH (DUF805 family)
MWSLSNRIGRWGFAGCSMISGCLIGLSSLAFHLAKLHGDPGPEIRLLAAIVSVCGVWIGLAACVRRLHDIGWSGWWVALTPVPVAGWMQGILLLVLPGQRAANRFGPPVAPHSSARLEPLPT